MKNAIIYGVGYYGKRLFYELKDKGISIVCFIDNYTNNKDFENISILRTEEVSEKYFNCNVYITATTHVNKIIKSLKKIGFNHIINLNKTKKIIDDKYSFKSYSQEGEDMLLRTIFANKRDGFYVDVGALHPKRFSNSYFFYRQGWSGINIDAMPGSMEKFNKDRKRDINLEKAISDKKQNHTYYVFNEPALNTFSKKLAKKYVQAGWGSIENKKKIKTITLESVLDLYLPKNKEIDFMDIDVEGFDFMALKSNNFNKYRPKIILIEELDSDFQKIKNGNIATFLNKQGYTIFAKLINTIFYIDDRYKQAIKNT